MRIHSDQLVFSATDLANHLACSHVTQLNRKYVEGKLKLEYREDPMLDLLIELGERHEQAYLDHLKGCGLSVLELKEFDGGNTKAAIKAMREGVDIIAQAWLISDPWRGRTDFLIKVDSPSDFGDWSYEVADTKLSQTTKSTAVIQLCLYSEMLAEVQGVMPTSMSVVKPGDTKADPFLIDRLRVTDYMAYFRMAKSRFESTMNADPDSSSYPEPCEHCSICNWWPLCNQKRRDDDHLSFVAGMTKSQRLEVVDQGLSTLTTFAEADKPLCEFPNRGAIESYDKSHRQAQIQLKGIRSGTPEYEFNAIEANRGFLRLPEPDLGDIFFDIEGNPRAMGDGLEYLFGFVTDGGGSSYQGIWGLNKRDERKSFEHFIDFILKRWEQFPGMHIYHFAPYESSALKRLSLRYATRETELDDLLRGEVFVDLYGITRQGIRASVESYSIKQLEQFYGFERAEVLKDASKALREVERLIELGMTDEIEDHHREVVENYNKDDCISTLVLRDWLEKLRTEFVATGAELTRPPLGDREAKDSVKEMSAEAQRVFDLLTFDIEEPEGENQSSRWLLAHMLEYFRREAKCKWWEFFRLRDLEHEELLQENLAVSGLEFIEEIPGARANSVPVHIYRFPEQETTLDDGHALWDIEGNPMGSVDHVDLRDRTIGIKKRKDTTGIHPYSVFEFKHIRPGSMPESLFQLGQQLSAAAKAGKDVLSARHDLLSSRTPRFKSLSLPRDGSFIEVATELAGDLEDSYLAIQGPPGTGKTYIGSHVIHALASKGKRVGVCAVSHAVIINLLSGVQKINEEGESVVRLAQQTSYDLPPNIDTLKNKDKSLEAINDGCVVGGTAWLWSDETMEQELDYLFIDEAGQMSLAMALAAGRAAKNIVLLGDPQQLEQPQQATHPEGSGIAALAHILQGSDTIPDDKGLFLADTWRLHPSICSFTSEQYYDDRLASIDGLSTQEVFGSAFSGNGLRYVPVEHHGNQNRSVEEVEAICTLVARLSDGSHQWSNKEAELAAITLDDILVVAPYNAQVSALTKALPDGARVGTVDKFQGQEAPIVIYSLTSSSADVAPRGIKFLFNRNRMNVASSRAKCLVLLVGSPALLDAECSTPEQMRLANGFCRFMELAD